MAAMAATMRLPISTQDIKQIKNPRTADATKLASITRMLVKLTKVVDRDWEKFDADTKVLLKAVAYDIIEEPKGLPALLLSIKSRALLAMFVLKGETDYLNDFFNAVNRFVDAILEKVEQDSLEYQELASRAVETVALNQSHDSPEMTAGEFRERFTRTFR